MKRCFLTAVCVAALCITVTTPANAYLGEFEGLDGYEPFLNDVATYNAGQYGPNAGGGVYVDIPDNTGLWQKLQGPLYPTAGTTGSVAYATGHQNADRTAPSTAAQALIITTNADGWSGSPQEYSYQVDSFDLGGVSPASTGGTTVDISFWTRSQLWGTGEGGGLTAGTVGNTVSFYDSSGNLGFGVGAIQPNTTTDEAAVNVNGTWVSTGSVITSGGWHRWDISMDLNAQTVDIDLFNGSLINVATGASLINTMSDFTEMRFLSSAGVNNSKLWALDDFTMTAVPEPSGCGLVAAMMLVCGCLRRR